MPSCNARRSLRGYAFGTSRLMTQYRGRPPMAATSLAFTRKLRRPSCRGVIHARERIEVHAGARIFAEIHTPALVVEEGAVLEGPIEAGSKTSAPAPVEESPR